MMMWYAASSTKVSNFSNIIQFTKKFNISLCFLNKFRTTQIIFTRKIYFKIRRHNFTSKLTDALLNLGFAQSSLNYSLFTKRPDKSIIVILVYVDDMLITCGDMNLIESTKKDLQQFFKIKDLGELKYFWGIEFSRSHTRILMNQRKYTLELIADLGMSVA